MSKYAPARGELIFFLQSSYCIKCGICISACPTSATDKFFLGLQASTQYYRYCAYMRDSGNNERLPTVDTDHGTWCCHLAEVCSEACPKVSDSALGIQLPKRLLVTKALRIGKKKPLAPVASSSALSRPKIATPEFTATQNGDETR